MSQATTDRGQAIVELSIEGMTCASCVRRVERALAGVDGVAAARANLANESAAIELAEGRPVEGAALVAAVEAAGYRVAPPAVSLGRGGDGHGSLRLEVGGMTCA